MLDDDKVASGTSGAAGTQANATPIRSNFTRFTGAANAATNTAVLPPLLSGRGFISFVINDAPNPIQVFCAPGENLQGSANGSLSIPAGQSAVFIPVTLKSRRLNVLPGRMSALSGYGKRFTFVPFELHTNDGDSGAALRVFPVLVAQRARRRQHDPQPIRAGFGRALAARAVNHSTNCEAPTLIHRAQPDRSASTYIRVAESLGWATAPRSD
jgi:hypothetical protein